MLMKNLREEIKKSPIRTQEMLSVVTGIHESLISKYCRGLRQPNEDHMRRIREALTLAMLNERERKAG
jgi:hypothetical protein